MTEICRKKDIELSYIFCYTEREHLICLFFITRKDNSAAMTYNSLQFILFFAVFLTLYLLMPRVRLRQIVILIGNVVFYKLAAGFNMLAVLVGTSLVIYVAGRIIDHIYAGYEAEKEGLTPKEATALFADYKKRAKKFLLLALLIILGILFYVKIGKLLGFKEVARVSQLFALKRVLIPLGLSYYTFSGVGYLLDIYWKKAKCEHDYFKLLVCMTYFPHIVQGPISRYHKLMKQFGTLPGFSYERVCFGLQRMLWGFFKKMVVADRLSLFTSTIFASPSSFAGIEIFFAVTLCAVELYADFSGCMDIVIGAAQTMGITLDENFSHPFFSKSAAEFWRRWHITLGAWFKDYVYMPIAMSPRFMKASVNIRKKRGTRIGQIFSSAIPLAVVWLLTGLWHGTGLDYVAWGCYWGILIILSAILAPDFKKWTQKLHIDTASFGWKLFQMVRTYFLFVIGRMLTVTGSLKGFGQLISGLFQEHRLWALFDGTLYQHGLDYKNFCVAIVGIFFIWIADMLGEHMRIRENLAKQPLVLRWLAYYGVIVLLLIFGMYGSAFDASKFVYGGF